MLKNTIFIQLAPPLPTTLKCNSSKWCKTVQFSK